jgi:hypothetical protein
MTYLSTHQTDSTNRKPQFGVSCKQDDAVLGFFSAYQYAAAGEATA